MGMTERQPREAVESAPRRIGRKVAGLQDEALGRLLRTSADERLAAVYKREAAASLRQAAPGGHPWRSRGLALLIAAALVVAALFWMRRRDESLSYEVAGTSGALGQWVAADGSPVALDFSDGSLVTVEPGGRARVTALGRRRADVLLERGTLHVRVVHRQDNAWVIASGPFLVHVVGTEFDVAWDASHDTLSVRMDSGRVRVEGPCVEADGRFVSAPETLRVSCSAPPAPSPHDRPTPSPSASAPAAATVEAPPSPSTTAPSAAPVPGWRSKLQAGQFREAFAEAESLGLDAVIASATGAELLDLGSAARLAGKGQVAAQLYQATRKRSPGSEAAANAAYQLGRMAFDGRGAWAEAEKWFASYLAERPGGSLAPEALGRSMECAKNRGDSARAKDLAARYLERYPKGAHASLAAGLLRESP
ncbi:MAG: FecR domain-containing protein [Myxococcales bacterium]|nr:FecR domain-containing protein [Myxococcales bacterium]